MMVHQKGQISDNSPKYLQILETEIYMTKDDLRAKIMKGTFYFIQKS